MLSMAAMSSGQASYYLGLAREDYYLEGGEPEGVWLGEGAALLGLTGNVKPDELYNLFDGLAPDGSVALVQLQNHTGKALHRPGWDLTFSAPKSVSALWSQTDGQTRQAIQQAHFEAVREAISYLEDHAVLTRRGARGQNLEHAGAVVATFEHSTSRALDPQLHTHALLMNVCVREDGSPGTVSSLSLFLAKMAAGALYRAHFAHLLEARLGLDIQADKSSFKVAGVSAALCEHFSQRRNEIEAELLSQGLTSAAGAAKVALETRDTKSDVSRAELFPRWQSDGEQFGFGSDQAQRLLRGPKRILPQKELAIIEAAQRLLMEGAHFSESDFLRRLAESSQGKGLSASDIRGITKEAVESCQDVIRLGPKKDGVHYTFADVLLAEDKFFKTCDDLHAREKHRVQPEVASAAIAESNRRNAGKELLPEQEAAVHWLTHETGDVAVMSGIAGSGKTRTLEAAARAWETSGFKVSGLALSGRASRELSQKADVHCTTIAKALYEISKPLVSVKWSSEAKRLYFDFRSPDYALTSKSVLIVDEAGMVNTADFLRLAEEVHKRGAKLVVVGDPKQLQAIQGASPLAEMIDRYKSAVLDVIMRQREQWAKDAVRDFAEGNAEAALERYAERGLLTVTKNQQQAREGLFEQWLASERDVRDKLILTDRREDARRLNEMAQKARSAELGITWVTVGETSIYLRDRVMITKTSQARGVNNGDLGTLVAINPLPGQRTATVKLDSGDKVTLELDAFPHLDLGYATTTHKFQGGTIKEAYVLTGSAMQDKHLSYVQGSRAEEKTHFFLTEGEAGDHLTDIAKRMSKDRQRTTARQELEQASEPDKKKTRRDWGHPR